MWKLKYPFLALFEGSVGASIKFGSHSLRDPIFQDSSEGSVIDLLQR
ncbi:hypothetical protein [Flagellimonas sp.]